MKNIHVLKLDVIDECYTKEISTKENLTNKLSLGPVSFLNSQL